MSKFIGVKVVEAEPLALGEYNLLRGWYTPAEENPEDPGYLVQYSDGYISWCPKENFDRQNISINGENNTVTQKDVDAMIKQIHVDENEPNDIGTKITVVTVTLANGFTITDSSTCIDPKNYDPEVGVMCCMERIEDKIWTLLAFLISCGVNGFQKGGGE